MQQLAKVTKSGLIKDTPGRIVYELKRNESALMQQLADAIKAAHVVMGLGYTTTGSLLNADIAIKKILDTYPGALIQDVLKAIEMASFGEIKLEGQLNQLSPVNIYNWYKEFRLNHPDKMVKPFKAIEHKEPELSFEEKVKLSTDLFTDWIQSSGPEFENMVEFFYPRLIEFEVMPLPDVATRTKIYQNIVLEVLKEKHHPFRNSLERHKECKRYFEFLEDLENPNWPNYALVEKNELHRFAVKKSKVQILIEFLNECDKQVVAEKYVEKVKINLQEKTTLKNADRII